MSARAVLGGLVVALLAVNGLILQKEWLLRRGDFILLELAPADPRSLMQGDFMALEYAVSRAVPAESVPDDGRLVVKVDANQVATFARVHQGEPLGADERLLRYRVRGRWRRVRLGAEEFFFQEGLADLYAPARYGELRVSSSGDAVLAGLRDAERNPLGPGR